MSHLEAVAAALASGRFDRKQLADGSGVVLDRERLRVLTLNDTGMSLIEALAGGAATVAELVQHLTARFDVDAKTARQDIAELLEELDALLEGKGRSRQAVNPP